MGLEIRIGYNDHRLVAQALTRDPSGLDAVVVDANRIGRHREAVEAAGRAGVPVVVETLSDRLAMPGFDPGDLDYSRSAEDLADRTSRDGYVQRVLEPQFAVNADIAVAPHIFASDDSILELNVDLVRRAAVVLSCDRPLRAVVAAPRRILSDPNRARELANELSAAGAASVDLRLSPLGGEDEGTPKLRSAFEVANAFGEFGLPVVLGYQGVIGEAALAAGLIVSFSTGITERDRYNFNAAISSQMSRRKLPKGTRPHRAAPRVLLPYAEAQLPKALAERILSRPGLRTRFPCRLGECAESISGPLDHVREHFLHSRLEAVKRIEETPPGMRVEVERKHLARAINLRERVVREVPEARNVKALGTRTLRSLHEILEQMAPARAGVGSR